MQFINGTLTSYLVNNSNTNGNRFLYNKRNKHNDNDDENDTQNKDNEIYINKKKVYVNDHS